MRRVRSALIPFSLAPSGCRTKISVRAGYCPSPGQPGLHKRASFFVRFLGTTGQRSVLQRARFEESFQPAESTPEDPADSFGAVYRSRDRTRHVASSRRRSQNEIEVDDPELRPLVPQFDEEFLKRPEVDADFSAEDLEHDVFGTITEPDWKKLKSYEDNEHVGDEIIPSRQRPWWYLLQVKKLIRKRDLPGALKYFEVKMRTEDKVRPLRTVYDMLIAACGRAGYTEKAFQLFTDMRQRRYVPVDATYVGLFNACAECPFPKEGIGRAKWLREQLQRKMFTPNQIVYHSMIKAFGRYGDIASAFQIADEMMSTKLELSEDTFSFLLMACVSDRTAGFKHAIEVWRSMVKCGIRPNNYHYNLLVRVIRDCGVGPRDLSNELLPPSSTLLLGQSDEMTKQLQPGVPILSREISRPEYLEVDRSKMLPSMEVSVTNLTLAEKYEADLQQFDAHHKPIDKPVTRSKDTSGHYQSQMRELLAEDYRRKVALQRGEWWESPQPQPMAGGAVGLTASHGLISVGKTAIPDLLLPFESQGNTGVIAIGDPSTAMERLELLGGYKGLFARMQRDNVTPDIKCLSMMVELLPTTHFAEDELLELAERLKIKLDVHFYNLIIKRRCQRNDLSGGLNILRLFESRGILPNEMTFGCLARACNMGTEIRELLKQMEVRDIQPNVKIMGQLVRKACWDKDVWTLLFLMKELKRKNVAPDERLLQKLEDFRNLVQKTVVHKERNLPVPEMYHDRRFLEGWKNFKLYYHQWLEQMPAPLEQHPYAPYRYTVEVEENDKEAFEKKREGKLRIKARFSGAV